MIEEIKKDNKVLRIYLDDFPSSPREYEDFGIIAFNHPKYELGEEKIEEPIEWLEKKLSLNPKNEYTEERLKELEEKFFKKFVAFPLYLYEHSGITIKTTPFSCKFDSGKVGYIYVTKEKMKKFSVDKKEAEEMLLREVKLFDTYLRGEVYCFELFEIVKVKITKEYEDGRIKVVKTEEEEFIDGGGNYYGEEGIEEIKQEGGF